MSEKILGIEVIVCVRTSQRTLECALHVPDQFPTAETAYLIRDALDRIGGEGWKTVVRTGEKTP